MNSFMEKDFDIAEDEDSLQPPMHFLNTNNSNNNKE